METNQLEKREQQRDNIIIEGSKLFWYFWKMAKSSENGKKGLDTIKTSIMSYNRIDILMSEKIIELLKYSLIDRECLLVGRR